MTIRFECDYAEGAHEAILQRLVETNLEQTPGYGMDDHCDRARQRIREACAADGADVHFLVGGTQTNTVMLTVALRPHQGVLAAATGHVAVHETGAIEATGHKVLTLPSTDGKITAQQVKDAHAAHWGDETHEHMVQPGAVYISHPSENGTTYTKAELEALHSTCKECGLFLLLDGARLGYGLAAPGSDLTLPDIARLCDMFYIGGTKVGALFGEAVVVNHEALKKDFRYIIKQRGGMLAKGRLLGIQFETLFADGLYTRLSTHAITQAMRIREALSARGLSFRYDSMTNQQFPIFPDAMLHTLNKRYAFSFWEKVDADSTAVRICTSWATQPEHVDQLIADIRSL